MVPRHGGHTHDTQMGRVHTRHLLESHRQIHTNTHHTHTHTNKHRADISWDICASSNYFTLRARRVNKRDDVSTLTGDAHRTMPLRPAAHTFLVHDEKLALEAIWPQEFEWKNDAFVLTLTPAEPVDEVFASVVIQVRPCEHSYPDTVPAITVSVIRGGLTEHHVADIERTLQSLAKTLVGEPMVHELAQQTREWLGRNNLRITFQRPRLEGGGS